MVTTEDYSYHPEEQASPKKRPKRLAIAPADIIRSYRLPDTPGRWQIVLYVIDRLKQQIAEGSIRNTYQDLLSALATLTLPSDSLFLLPQALSSTIDAPSQSALDPDNWVYMADAIYHSGLNTIPTTLSRYPRVSTNEMMRSFHFFSRLFTDDRLDEKDFEAPIENRAYTYFQAMKKIDAAMYAVLSDGSRRVTMYDVPLQEFICEYKRHYPLSLMPAKDDLVEYLMGGLVFQLVAEPEVFPFPDFVEHYRNVENTRVLQEVFRLADYWATAATTASHPLFFSNRTTHIGYSTNMLYRLGQVGFSTFFSPYRVTVPTDRQNDSKEVTVWKLPTHKTFEPGQMQEANEFGYALLRFFAVALLSPTSHVVNPKNSQIDQTYIAASGRHDPLCDPYYRVTVRNYDWTAGIDNLPQIPATTPEQAALFRSILVPLGYCVHALHAFRFDQKKFYQDVWKPVAGF